MKAVLLALILLAGTVGFASLPDDSPASPAVEVITPRAPEPEQRWEIRPIPPYDSTPDDHGPELHRPWPTLPPPH